MKRGRPTREEEKKIRQTILGFYERDISITVAARHLGVNPKTVSKYYKNWDKQRIDPDDEDIMSRIKKTKESAIQSLEEDIISLTLDIKNYEFLMRKASQKGDNKEHERIAKLKLKSIAQRCGFIALRATHKLVNG